MGSGDAKLGKGHLDTGIRLNRSIKTDLQHLKN